MKKLLNKLAALWYKLPDSVRRVIHTAWQVAGGALLAYLTAHSQDIATQGIWTFVYAAALAAGKAGIKSVVARS